MEEKTKRVQTYKLEAVSKLQDLIGDYKDFIFTDFRGLSVEEITDLRGKLREKDSKFKVVKNNYFKIAFSKSSYPEVDSFLIGPTGIALVKEDSGPVAKILLEFAKNTSLALKGGVIDGNPFDMAQLEALSKLPGKEQLIAMLMSTMNAPLQNMVYVMNGVTQKLVRTLQAVADKKAEA